MAGASDRAHAPLLGHLVRFSRALHDAGVLVNPANVIELCQCFAYVDVCRRDDFYAAARATLISNRDQVERFDEVFAWFWERPETVRFHQRGHEAESDDPEPDRPRAALKLSQDEDGQSEAGTENPRTELAYSPDEVLLTRDLGTLSEADLERARRLIRELVAALATHWSRRYRARNRGRELDFRRMLRAGARYGHEGFIPLVFRDRRIRRTSLVLLCDVSGSMQRYSGFLIEFMYALRREIADLEVVVFSTRITVISELLKRKSVEESIKRVADTVHDWAGGTDIGASIRQFNEQFALRMLRSRSVVMLLSDGWDRGDAGQMRQEMETLRRRAHTLLWLNPLLGRPGYQPLCRGMQTALPYLDYFLPAHNLQSLAQLTRTLRAIWR